MTLEAFPPPVIPIYSMGIWWIEENIHWRSCWAYWPSNWQILKLCIFYEETTRPMACIKTTVFAMKSLLNMIMKFSWRSKICLIVSRIFRFIKWYFWWIHVALPLAAVVENKVFVVHGGIGPRTYRMDLAALNSIDRQEETVVRSELLWSGSCKNDIFLLISFHYVPSYW